MGIGRGRVGGREGNVGGRVGIGTGIGRGTGWDRDGRDWWGIGMGGDRKGTVGIGRGRVGG